MSDPVTALDFVKDGVETLSQYIASEPVTAIANLCTITSLSLRNAKGLFCFKKWGEKFKEKFPNGLETEKQESILTDSFVELEDYIKNNANFDDNVFEKIGALLIHGLEREDLLTREYIKILKHLSWVDLDVLIHSNGLEILSHVKESHYIMGLTIEKLRNEILKGYPTEIIENSLIHLKELNILKESPLKNKYTSFSGTLTTDLSSKIVSLII